MMKSSSRSLSMAKGKGSPLSIGEGRLAVKIARDSIESLLSGKRVMDTERYPKIFREKLGAFTSLHTHPGKELRGCIGFPEPIMPLSQAIADSAVSAARDPRFPPLEESELKRVVIEVSVLTRPELIPVRKPEEYLKKITPGRDGLVLKRGPFQGLFLPQVWEQIPGKVGFLEHLSQKAGLMPDAWIAEDSEIYRFMVQAFEEERPGGRVREKRV